MEINKLPPMNLDTSETGCCPKFNPDGWDGQIFVFKDKLFAKTKTKSFMHIPLNMGSMYKKFCAKAEKEKAFAKDYYLILSHDPSPWRSEHYFSVEKDVSDEEMVRLSGSYLTKVFEGPFKNVGKWVKEMEKYTKDKNKQIKKLYFFYTTCPKCLKHYGKNYVVAFAEV